MCSINGINFKDEKLIKNITNSNNFRGPDKTQIFSYENYLSIEVKNYESLNIIN